MSLSQSSSTFLLLECSSELSRMQFSVFGLSQQFPVCTEVTFAIPSPGGICQDNKVISYEQKNYKHLSFPKGDIDYCLQRCGLECASFSCMNPCALAKKVLHFPFFLSCCIQPWHWVRLLYLFLGCAGSSFGI